MAFFAKCNCGLCDTEVPLEGTTRVAAEAEVAFLNLMVKNGVADFLFGGTPETKENFNIVVVER